MIDWSALVRFGRSDFRHGVELPATIIAFESEGKRLYACCADQSRWRVLHWRGFMVCLRSGA